MDTPLIQIQTRPPESSPAAGATGRTYWRSLDELAGTAAFRDWVSREFPKGAAELLDEPSRRNMLKVMAASFGLAGLTACRRPAQKVLPLVKSAENYIPGKPLYYSTAMSVGGAATGLIVEVNDGRPTKVEGNPEHPFSLGAANPYHQASILSLYDPDRMPGPRREGAIASWEEFRKWAGNEFDRARRGAGDGIRFLSESVSSPSLAALKTHTLSVFPNAKWVEWDSIQSGGGNAAIPRYRLDKADVVVSLDADFLGVDSATVLPAKEFSRKRRVTQPSDTMNRLYVVEPQYSITGAMADHRLRLKPSEVTAFAAALRAAVAAGEGAHATDPKARLIAAIAKDLNTARGRSLVIAGPRQPASVHAAALEINTVLGNLGQTISYYQGAAQTRPQVEALKELAGELAGGKVTHLVILGGNPAFTAPADLELTANIRKAPQAIYLGQEWDETAKACKWALPEAHYLESWGDATAPDGLVTIQQPMIEPLHGGKTAAELLAELTGFKDRKAYDIVRNLWVTRLGGGTAGEKAWRRALHDGMIKDAAVPAGTEVKPVAPPAGPAPAGSPGGMEVVFVPSSMVYDGRFANNGWLQEMSDPMTKLTWDNAALISPATARRLGVASGEMLVLERSGRKLEIPALVQPGQADDTLVLPLGYGRTECGRVGRGVGFNPYLLRTSDALGFATGVSVRKGSGTHQLVQTQEHHMIAQDDLGKDEAQRRASYLVREATIEEYRKHPDMIEHMVHVLPDTALYQPPVKYDRGYQWGMAIDLSACIGCNACVVACQAENNIPVVGKEQVARGREMQWIRLDRYYSGTEDDPRALNQPVPCMQCENAPCENVCPVNATAHTPEGLNDMAYNRCVGTRYCSNNCPYKVRRFNYYNWHYDKPEIEKLSFNPEVTVRMRGVMEKCTYCVQRIQEKRIEAKTDGRRAIKDGELMTACQQTCPADAIVFGNINDPNSLVSKLKAQQRNYGMLEDINTKPRTTYLAKLRNPNPELEEAHHG